MATPMEVRQKHRAAIKFLFAEGVTPANIHKRLQNVYKGDSLEYINGWRWACRLNEDIKFGSGKNASAVPMQAAIDTKLTTLFPYFNSFLPHKNHDCSMFKTGDTKPGRSAAVPKSAARGRQKSDQVARVLFQKSKV